MKNVSNHEVSYYVSEWNVLHVFIDGRLAATVSQCANNEADDLVEEVLAELGYER